MSDKQETSPRGRGRGRGRGGRRSGTSVGEDEAGADSPKHGRVLSEEEKADFVSYQQEMDQRRDRYERIVKLSRDLIIECKRIIFQLHRFPTAKTPEEKEMDQRRDRYERIVKLSRDLIIECKRIIFQLHRFPTAKTPEEKENLLSEVGGRLDDVRNKIIHGIAVELRGQDHYYYAKSYVW
ncbi:unnamed protein product, partial [Gongylonema pulchrum]|uniref:Translin-associated protein X n=1 Tax=Gongylonema pulchrum TaxID=637853 RepID=A0A183E874_9BILA